MEDNEKIENNVQIENCISGDENSFNNLNVKKIFGDNVKYYRKKNGIVAGTIVRDFGNFSKSFECDRNWWQICNFQTSRKNGFCI